MFFFFIVAWSWHNSDGSIGCNGLPDVRSQVLQSLLVRFVEQALYQI